MELPTLDKILEWLVTPIEIGSSKVSIVGIGIAFLIFFAALALSALIQRIMTNRLSGRIGVSPGVFYAIRRVVHYLIISVGLLVALNFIGLDFTALAVVFGFLSVGIGFGFQNITSNFISGLILLFERPISIGDFVTVGDQVGAVKDIKMRSTLIQTQDNIAIIIPNSKFLDQEVTNWSHGNPRVRIHVPVGVEYGCDLEKVKEALLRVAVEDSDVLDSPAPEVRFLEFGDSSLNFELLAWIARPEAQWAMKSQLNFEIDAALREAGIGIPFPQRDLHIKPAEGLATVAGMTSGQS